MRKKLLLAKTKRRSYQVEKGRTNAWLENLITNTVRQSEWKDNFREKGFKSYAIC